MTGRVLVVDDDPDLRETVADVLVAAGFAVETADNGQTALELLERAATLPDVILLDMMMPVMDGRAFSIAMRERVRLAGIPLIVFSAHADLAEAAKSVHAVRSLTKPLRAQPLIDAIAGVVAAAR